MNRLRIQAAVVIVALPLSSQALGQSALILNEANCVSGSSYLGGARVDPTLGRVQGNGQNWLEFLVVDADPGKNTLDLRGWKLDWSYQDPDLGEQDNHGEGTITFSNDPLWAAVPRGTMLTIAEWKEVYYLTNTPPYDDPPGGDIENPDGDPLAAGGIQRVGGIMGLGTPTGATFDAGIHTKIDHGSKTSWSPLAQSGADWNIHVWAGERDALNNFRYFSFTGTISEMDGDDPDTDPDVYTVGVDDAAGLFAANNDEWRITIRDSGGNVKQGPIGEHVAGWTGGGINSGENLKLEAFVAGGTLADYQNVTVASYQDGSSSAFGVANQWDGGANVQDLSPLRAWFAAISPGDVNLDGVVDIFDVNRVSANWGAGNGSLGGDGNGDGNTDIFDVNLISAHWTGGGGGAAQIVPEPAAAWLMSCAAVALAWCAVARVVRR